MEDNRIDKDSLFEKLESYGKTSLELFKLKALDKAADVSSSIVSNIIMGLTLIIFIIALNIALGFWLGQILGKVHYGFFVVAGFYGCLSLGFYLYKDSLVKTPISNAIIIGVLSDMEEKKLTIDTKEEEFTSTISTENHNN